jgi:hypothetical protein
VGHCPIIMLDIPDGQVDIRMYVKKLGIDEREECSSELCSKTDKTYAVKGKA